MVFLAESAIEKVECYITRVVTHISPLQFNLPKLRLTDGSTENYA